MGISHSVLCMRVNQPTQQPHMCQTNRQRILHLLQTEDNNLYSNYLSQYDLLCTLSKRSWLVKNLLNTQYKLQD